MATDVTDWPGDTYCIGQTTVPGTVVEAGAEAGAEGGADAAMEASTTASTCNPTPATEVFLQGVSTVTYDPAVGDPNVGGDLGSLKFDIPFFGYNQQADFQHLFTGTPLQVLAGQTLFVRVRLDSGFTPSASYPGGFVLAVKSGTGYTYASSTYTNITAPNVWYTVSLPVSAPPFVDTTNPAGYDPTNIVAIELHFDTGSGPAAGVDAGAPPSEAIFHIDTIGYLPTQ
jgi:hypothetical protein